MILIIQNGYITTNVEKYLDEDFELIRSYQSSIDEVNLDRYSLVIILGGNQRIRNIKFHTGLQKVLKIIKKCLEIKKPVLGICLGCQLIAHHLGCEIKSDDFPNMGYDTRVLGFEYIFRYHYDYIVPNDHIEVLDSFKGMPYIVRHQNLLGVQCHPDIPPENIVEYHPHIGYIEWIRENQKKIDQNNRDLMQYLINLAKKIEK